MLRECSRRITEASENQKDSLCFKEDDDSNERPQSVASIDESRWIQADLDRSRGIDLNHILAAKASYGLDIIRRMDIHPYNA